MQQAVIVSILLVGSTLVGSAAVWSVLALLLHLMQPSGGKPEVFSPPHADGSTESL